MKVFTTGVLAIIFFSALLYAAPVDDEAVADMDETREDKEVAVEETKDEDKDDEKDAKAAEDEDKSVYRKYTGGPTWGKRQGIFTDRQCRNLGNKNNLSLSACKTVCDGNKACTAINYNRFKKYCTMRKCKTSKPAGRARGWKSYVKSGSQSVPKVASTADCDTNKKLNGGGNKAQMEQGGWKLNLNVPNANVAGVGNSCASGKKWFGWSGGSGVGTLSATLAGSGKATIVFGNCWNAGVVNLYLNDRKLATAAVGQKSKKFQFSYTAGSVLKLKDEGGNSVISLNSISFDCTNADG